jgi:hypothetical protein
MRRFSTTTALLLTLVLALGFAPVWGFVAGSLIDWVLPSHAGQASFMVQQDGTPLMQHMDAVNHSLFYTDLRGQPVEVNSEDLALPWADLQMPDAEDRSETIWRGRILRFSDKRSRPTNWYAISDGRSPGRAYFVGYDVASKYRVGFLAKDGFRESQPPAEDCFPIAGGARGIHNRVVSVQSPGMYTFGGSDAYARSPGAETSDFKDWQHFLLGDDQRIYEIDLRERSVRVAFTALHIKAGELYSKNSKSPTFLVVRTDHELLVLNRQFKVERTYTIPAELATRPFRWAEVAPDHALATWTRYSLSVTDNGAEAIAWFDQAGKISRRETGPARTNAWYNTTIALACPIFVIVVLMVGWICPYELLEKGTTDSWSIAQRVAIEGSWPAIVFVTVLSAALAVACYRRQVRYAVTPAERTVWPIFVFLGGLPVWVVYRFGRHWPVLERCPECGALNPRDRETCVACRQEFPLPEREGFEILAV